MFRSSNKFWGVLLLLSLLLAACVQEQGPTAQPTTKASDAAQSAAGYPVTIESCGHTLTFTKAPERVLIDYQTQLELFLRLGLGDRIAAYSGFGEVPLAPDVTAAFAQISERASKLDAFPNKEQAVTAKYDLVTMAFPSGMYDVSRGRATREEWEQAGTQIYESNADCANGKADRTLNDSFQQIRDIGRIFNVSDRAEALVAQMQQTLEMVQSKVKGLPKPKVAILDYIDDKNVPYFYAAGIYTDMIERAGGENVFADQTQQYTEISPEVVAARPVDVLFVMQWEGTISAEQKAEYYYATFPNAPVSKNHRIAVLTNMELNAGSSNTIAIEKMARALHPEAFAAPATAAVGYPVTVENCGNTLTLQKRPERVIVSWGGEAAYLLELGLDKELIGIYYRSADDENRLVPPALRDRFLAIPNLGKDGVPPGKEIPISLKADFFYSDNPGDFADGRATPEDFAAIGATVFSSVYGCTDPAQQTLEQMFDEIQNLGRIFAEEAAAQALVNKIRTGVEAVQARVAGQAPVRALLVEGSAKTLYAAGNGLVTDVFARAGGTNIFDGASYDAPPSREVLAASKPDVVLIWDYNADELEPVVRAVFANSPAVANNRIVRIPYIGGVGMRVAELAEALGRAFHPDAFATSATAGNYPVTIENCGNTLTFAKAPERVVSYYPPNTEMLILLGVQDRIVGVGNYKDASYLLPEVAAAYKALEPKKLSDNSVIAKEVLLTAHPDLVTDNQPDWFYDAKNGGASVEEIHNAGAQIYTLTAKCGGGKTNATMDDVYTDLENYGKIFGVEARATALIAKMKATVDDVQSKIKGQPPVKALVYDAGEGPLGVFGPGAWAYVLELAGGVNVFADLPTSYSQVSVEEVATRDIDVFVVPDYGPDYTYAPSAQARGEWLIKTFPNTAAAKNHRVVILPYQNINPSAENAEGVLALAKGFYPALFTGK